MQEYCVAAAPNIRNRNNPDPPGVYSAPVRTGSVSGVPKGESVT